MKRRLFFLLLIAMTCAIATVAQTISFRTTSFCYKQNNGYGWTAWSQTERSDMLVTVNFDNDVVTIYSPTTQYYKITQYISQGYDGDGDYVVRYKFVDQDGDRGTMRLIQRTSGKSEIYIDFANIMWCYSVIRI